MFGKLVIGRAGIIVLGTAVLSACAGQPETIVASDAALCQYSAAAAGAQSDAQCRQRLQSQRGRLSAASASRIEGYALLNAPPPPADIAGACKESEKTKNCDPADLTGSIPEPKR